MSMLVQLVGVLVAVWGVFAFGAPDLLYRGLNWCEQQRARARAVGLLEAIFGVVLLAGAPQSRWPGAMTVLGGFLIGAGLLFGMSGFPRALDLVLFGSRRRSRVLLRAWGAITAVVGVLIVYAVR